MVQIRAMAMRPAASSAKASSSKPSERDVKSAAAATETAAPRHSVKPGCPPKSQGASQAMLYATGLNEEDMNKPQVC